MTSLELIDTNITAYFNEYGAMPTHVLVPPKYSLDDATTHIRGVRIIQIYESDIFTVLVGRLKNYVRN